MVSTANPQPLPFATLHALSEGLANGTLSAAQLTEHLLARIERLDGKLHAFVKTYADDVRWMAAAADQSFKAGHRIGPLHGIPIAVKDLIDIEGRITTGGSAVWRERMSPYTATLVRRLIGAGMIVLGKTHTVEFAMGGYGTNNSMGTPWNPWDLHTHRAPGGSSAGSGVAVAAGLAPCAIGTDTGGSVRLPCAWNGLTGLKTTVGRVSCHGVLPLSSSLDTPGPMCHDAEDAAMLFSVLHGPDSHDPLTLRHGPVYPVETLRNDIAGLRVGTLDAPEREQVDTDVLDAYDTFLEQLKRLGARLVKVSLPLSSAQMGELLGKIISVEGYSVVGHLVDDPAQPLDDDIRPRIAPGKHVSAVEYLKLMRLRRIHQRDINNLMNCADTWVTPATTTPAPIVASIDQSTTPATFTRPINYLDWCSLALPIGFTEQGLPLSAQIACKSGEEALALRIGHAYQQATDWHQRHPSGLD